MKSLNVLADTYEWFVRAVPKPNDKNLHVQLGVHFEEVHELICEMHSRDLPTSVKIDAAKKAMEELADHLKQTQGVICFSDRNATLDAICDQLVTGTGLARMLDMDPVGGLAEVNRSNWSKFVNGEPTFNEKGKIMKGPDYTEPHLDLFV